MKEKNIIAVMLGHAVADALGVPYEFSERERLIRAPATDMVGYRCYPVPAGTWSDDTSMSLATLDRLADGIVDYEGTMQGFEKWLFDDYYTATGEAFDVGMTCQIVISNYRARIYDNVFDYGLRNEDSNGNGSLMRIHPVSLFLYYTRRDRAAHLDIIHSFSALTHAHQRSMIACGIYSFILWELLDNPSKNSVLSGLTKAKEYYKDYDEIKHYERLFEVIGRAPCSLCADEISSSGYVVSTIEAAIWCLLTTDDYKSCALKAVNLGSDTDTVAAIAGGLAGALYGYASIPDEWLRALAKRKYIVEMCERAAKCWEYEI